MLVPMSTHRNLLVFCKVTLACTAAFAAGSTALFCILFLSGQPSNVNILGLHARLDLPNDIGVVKCDNPTVKTSHYRRRSTMRPNDGSRLQDEPLQWPEGAVWLMSYPNSGTSFTIHAIREISNTTTATNYGLEGDIKDEASVPAFKGRLDGPFLERVPGRSINIPRLILTKTHCGGVSTSRNPSSYIESPRSFLTSCLKSKRGVFSPEKQSLTTHTAWYNEDLVKKVLHIFRDPLDNTVARFHLERKRFTAMKDYAWLKQYPNNKVGFRKWCSFIDESPKLKEWVDKDLVASFKGVPCHAEFYRFVEWHNLAFASSLSLDLPTMVFHYEDYSTRFDDLTTELIDFLELERTGVAPPFISNKEYSDYYTEDETRAISTLVKELSTRKTWHYLARYFEERSTTDSY